MLAILDPLISLIPPLFSFFSLLLVQKVEGKGEKPKDTFWRDRKLWLSFAYGSNFFFPYSPRSLVFTFTRSRKVMSTTCEQIFRRCKMRNAKIPLEIERSK